MTVGGGGAQEVSILLLVRQSGRRGCVGNEGNSLVGFTLTKRKRQTRPMKNCEYHIFNARIMGFDCVAPFTEH